MRACASFVKGKCAMERLEGQSTCLPAENRKESTPAPPHPPTANAATVLGDSVDSPLLFFPVPKEHTQRSPEAGLDAWTCRDLTGRRTAAAAAERDVEACKDRPRAGAENCVAPRAASI